MLVTDIERIQRAKKILRNPEEDRRKRIEAQECLNLYIELSTEFNQKGNEEQRERAREIMYELYKC